MDIILHVGAHRTASTSFQHYMRMRGQEMRTRGLGFWGPNRTRGGLFAGLFPGPGIACGRNARFRAKGRVRMHLDQARQKGLRQLMISDENMIGTARQCIRTASPYPAIGERMARYAEAFGVAPRRALLSVRSQDLWWASAMALTVSRGYPVPSSALLEEISLNLRGWRDVITDLACALPETEIIVAPFEQFAGRPDALLAAATDVNGPREQTPLWRGRSPDKPTLRRKIEEAGFDASAIPPGEGRWQPFDDVQTTRLRELYADDMHWLIAGAEGLATLAQDPTRIQTGSSLQAGVLTEGSETYDSGQKRMA